MNDALNRFTEIGTIGKSHGLEGTVRVHLSEEGVSLIEEGVILYLQSRRGDLIPARIESFRVEDKQMKQLFFVKFDRIADRKEAESFQDTVLYTDMDIPVDSSAESTEPDLTGYDVFEESVKIGYVVDVLENPAHPILEVKLSDDGYPAILLVPVVSEYVLRTDHDKEQLICQNLDRLKDL